MSAKVQMARFLSNLCCSYLYLKMIMVGRDALLKKNSYMNKLKSFKSEFICLIDSIPPNLF
jgi:hypothetical protein